MAKELTAAAQYLRMSTEHQQYSIENQAAAIQTYAEFNGFEIVQTYADPARSGVVLKRRTGLQHLLQDVVSGKAAYKAILVYDVSRWGRFQDMDESAHYEFLCKSAGIPVHYCAEIFANDLALPNLIMKALKRTMAGEYSRELSTKVSAGQRRIAKLGFKQGGAAGYGLRRMLVGPDRRPKQELQNRDRKSLATDRVTLVPGPRSEINIVNEIYRLLVFDGLSVHGIADKLNRHGIEFAPNSKWDYAAVYGVLTGLKYIGCHAFGRTSSKLYTPVIMLPKSQWIVVDGAFEPIVDYGLYAQAQEILYYRSLNKSDEELLWMLRNLLQREGRLSGSLIARSSGISSPSTYTKRFGSLQRAYQLIGYGRAEQFGPIDGRRRTQALRKELVEKLLQIFPKDLSIINRGGRWRPELQLKGGEMVSVLLAPSFRLYNGSVRWKIRPVRGELQRATLLARLDITGRSFLDFHLLPSMDRLHPFQIRETDSWLDRGVPLPDLSQFLPRLFVVCSARSST